VAPQFRSFNRDPALLTETLRSSDPDFRGCTRPAPEREPADRLIRENRPTCRSCSTTS
jgi:hypothetical protein